MPETLGRRLPDVAPAPWLKVLPPMTRFVFNGDTAARKALAAVWGTGFAEQACRARLQGTRASLWLGPDEYLLLDAALEPDLELFVWLESAMVIDSATLRPHSLVDVSHRQFGLEIHGPHAETILRGACPLDLELAEFPVHMCTRTVLAKADIVLWRTREDAFHLEVWRSFAGYVAGLLGAIAAEFHPAA